MPQEAMFGAGCFWGVEEAFRSLDGVSLTEAGYAGGDFDNPRYEDVCSGRTGHAEVVHLEYDPDKISYDQLLDLFWTIHDPAQVNRQGPDVGYQYRSVIFYYTPQQQAAAESSKAALAAGGREIATRVEPAPRFWRAEEYHQQYVAKKKAMR